MKTTQPADIGIFYTQNIILSEIIYIIFLISVLHLKTSASLCLFKLVRLRRNFFDINYELM